MIFRFLRISASSITSNILAAVDRRVYRVGLSPKATYRNVMKCIVLFIFVYSIACSFLQTALKRVSGKLPSILKQGGGS